VVALLHSETRPFLDQVSPKSPLGVYREARKEKNVLFRYWTHRNGIVALQVRGAMRGLEALVGCSTEYHFNTPPFLSKPV